MNPKICFAFVILAVVHQVYPACLCSFGEGKEICNPSKSAPLVIRPATLPKINLESYTKPRVVVQTIPGNLNAFKPIGDLCSCKQSIVFPAVVPKPVCAACSGGSSSTSSSSSSSSSSSASSSTGSNLGEIIFGSGPYGSISTSSSSSNTGSTSSGNNWASSSGTDYIVDGGNNYAYEGPTSATADPLSIALAYQASNQASKVNCLAESRLCYGFRKVPVDVIVEKPQAPTIDEQSLYTLNGPIVEMKRIAPNSPISIDEEALEQLEAEAEAEELESQGNDAGPIKTLRYGDLGYGISRPKEVTFNTVSNTAEVVQPVETIGFCNDGYQAGNVITKNTLQDEAFVSGPSVPLDFGGGSTDVYKQPVYVTYSNGAVSSSASAAASSSSSGRHYKYFNL